MESSHGTTHGLPPSQSVQDVAGILVHQMNPQPSRQGPLKKRIKTDMTGVPGTAPIPSAIGAGAPVVTAAPQFNSIPQTQQYSQPPLFPSADPSSGAASTPAGAVRVFSSLPSSSSDAVQVQVQVQEAAGVGVGTGEIGDWRTGYIPTRITVDEDSESDDDESEEGVERKLYCVCRMPYREGEFMVGCDRCDDWFHPNCVNIDEALARRDDYDYVCRRCRKKEKKELKRKRKEEERRKKELKEARRREAEETERKRMEVAARARIERSPSLMDAAQGLLNIRASPTPIVKKRICGHPACEKPAAENSKYCSEDCGLRSAQDFIRSIVKREPSEPEIMLYPMTHSSDLSTGKVIVENKDEDKEKGKEDVTAAFGKFRNDEEKKKRIEKIASELVILKENVSKTRMQQIELEGLVADDDKIVSKVLEEAKSKGEGEKGKEDGGEGEEGEGEGETCGGVVDCPSCGSSYQSQKFPQHHDLCFMKTEQQFSEANLLKTTPQEGRVSDMHCNHYDPRKKTYCKKLKSNCSHHTVVRLQSQRAVCLCPLMDDLGNVSSRCLVEKSACLLHVGWEGIWSSTYKQRLLALQHTIRELEAEKQLIDS